MEKKRALIVAGLGLVLLATVAYLAFAFWPVLSEDNPTLMYFRADL